MVARTGAGPSASEAGLAWLREIGGAVADLFFPPRCVECGSFGAWLCPRCIDKIENIRPPVCSVCGLPLRSPSGSQPAHSNDDGSRCARCRGTSSPMDGLRACAYHSGPLRTAIHHFKYEDLRVLAAPLARLMALGWATLRPEGIEVDTIVPVPLHKSRERERGYNQAALLARELAVHLERPEVEGVLIRTRATAPQVGLDSKQRQANVLDAFECKGTRLAGRRILLVDDVCTTGATLGAACAALRLAGASSIWGYVLAHAR